jgi:hypothetical protein
MIDTYHLVRAKCIRPEKTKNGPTARRASEELGMGREYSGLRCGRSRAAATRVWRDL